ncbi:MAG TPA: PPC domain-containing DNA-binding protein [Methanomassiliicoccales archaeon]|nr:PPC domain-containing DNA-binding protein [Methanomassiliicoccales archaeon]
MTLGDFKLKRSHIISVAHGSDLLRFITELAEKEKITNAVFFGIGALKCATLGAYDQQRHEYLEIAIETPHEIASCTGNISLKDGKPFVHAHAVLSDEKGSVKAGHLFGGVVFAAELLIQEFDGPRLERKFDELTGLSLWEATKN